MFLELWLLITFQAGGEFTITLRDFLTLLGLIVAGVANWFVMRNRIDRLEQKLLAVDPQIMRRDLDTMAGKVELLSKTKLDAVQFQKTVGEITGKVATGMAEITEVFHDVDTLTKENRWRIKALEEARQ